MSPDFFSVAQMFGHVTFLLGMVTFSRKSDTHFKKWLTAQNLLYATHFYLMGNPAAMAGALLSAARNVLSMKTRALWLAFLLLSLNVALGFVFVHSLWNVLPLLATAVATLSMFRLEGMRLRCGMLVATLLWLVNNLHTGSIGGTVMETTIALVSVVTIFRLWRDARELPAADPVRP